MQKINLWKKGKVILMCVFLTITEYNRTDNLAVTIKHKNLSMITELCNSTVNRLTITMSRCKEIYIRLDTSTKLFYLKKIILDKTFHKIKCCKDEQH